MLVVCTIGDLLLDVIVRLDGPIAEDTDTYGRTRVTVGGQAANVAAWVVALGGRSRFLGKHADDAAGRVVVGELVRRGVEVLGPAVAEGTGTVVSIAASDGTRTMLTDRGVAPDFRPDELDDTWLGGCDCLHVPGYSLVRSPLRETALDAVGLARRGGARVSVDASSTSAIRASGVEGFREALRRVRPDALLATEDEAELVGELEAPVVVVKRGGDGCRVRTEDGERDLPAVASTGVDSTGAGDAFAAGFLLGGPALALEAAARCVARMGAMP